MEYRSLDLTIISADDIKDVKFFSKMSVYVVVSLMGQSKTKKKTHVHKKCGTCPRWNHRMKFTIDEPSLSNPAISLLFQVKCESFFHGSRDIGEVCVPLRELFKEDDINGLEESAEKVIDYQVRTPSGKPKGTFKFSYKFSEKFTQDHLEANKKITLEPVTAYPAAATPGPSHEGGMAYAAYTGNGYAAMPSPPSGYQHGGGYPPQRYPTYHAGPGPFMYPPPSGYGYPPPPPQGYGYPPPPPMQHVVQQPARNMMGGGAGLGMGLAGGLLGGMLLGEMVSDMEDMAAYEAGYDDAMGMDGF